MTAGVLRDILNHEKISLRNICLLIFDECHHADPDSKSDFTDICQHLHSFPSGKWLPDYSRGPKVAIVLIDRLIGAFPGFGFVSILGEQCESWRISGDENSSFGTLNACSRRDFD